MWPLFKGFIPENSLIYMHENYSNGSYMKTLLYNFMTIFIWFVHEKVLIPSWSHFTINMVEREREREQNIELTAYLDSQEGVLYKEKIGETYVRYGSQTR